MVLLSLSLNVFYPRTRNAPSSAVSNTASTLGDIWETKPPPWGSLCTDAVRGVNIGWTLNACALMLAALFWAVST